MGHHTETVRLNLEDAHDGREALYAAVCYWGDRHSNRYDSPRAEYKGTLPLMGFAAAEANMDSAMTGKWRVSDEQSVVVRLCADDDLVTKTVTRKLVLTAQELTKVRGKHVWQLTQYCREKLDENIIAAEIVSLPKARKPLAAATEGKAVTMYQVVSIRDFGSRSPVGGLHPSQAAARQAAITMMEKNPGASNLGVTAVVVRDTGNDLLVTIDRVEPETATVTVKVTTATPKPGAKQVGWLVGFDYHS